MAAIPPKVNLRRVGQFPAACCGSLASSSFSIPRSLLRRSFIPKPKPPKAKPRAKLKKGGDVYV
jgi:hypothetical protein